MFFRLDFTEKISKQNILISILYHLRYSKLLRKKKKKNLNSEHKAILAEKKNIVPKSLHGVNVISQDLCPNKLILFSNSFYIEFLTFESGIK